MWCFGCLLLYFAKQGALCILHSMVETIQRFVIQYSGVLAAVTSILLLLLFSFWSYRKASKHAENQSKQHLFPFIFRNVVLPLKWLLFFLVANIIVAQSIKLPEKWELVFEEWSSRAFIILLGWLVARILRAVKNHALKLHDMTVSDNFNARKRHTQFTVLYRVAVFIVILITASFVLLTFNGVADIGKSLLASAGVAGIIIGFAAQKTIGSVFAGIQIAITQPIRIEDAVVVEGEWGWIEEVTLTYVVIRIWDLRRLIVPITYFIENPFQNWTRKEAEILGSVMIHTDYRLPVDEMRKELDRLLDETELWNGKAKVLQVVDTTDRTLVLRALMSGKDSPTTWDLRCYVREGLIAWLQQHYPEFLPKTRMEFENPIPPLPMKESRT